MIPLADPFTHGQVRAYLTAYELISKIIGYRPLQHVLNSAGIGRFPQYHFDMVRTGIGLYGYDPNEQLDLRPVSRLLTYVSQVKVVKAGDHVGYGRSGTISTDGKLAIVPIGYADGYDRRHGKGVSQIRWKDQLLPTIGTICMDMTMLAIGNLPVNEGDEIEVFGTNPSLNTLAQSIGTIPYEILTSISQRVVRIYESE